jgi:hypothetical protein
VVAEVVEGQTLADLTLGPLTAHVPGSAAGPCSRNAKTLGGPEEHRAWARANQGPVGEGEGASLLVQPVGGTLT